MLTPPSVVFQAVTMWNGASSPSCRCDSDDEWGCDCPGREDSSDVVEALRGTHALDLIAARDSASDPRVYMIDGERHHHRDRLQQ